jgi:hypothetical protein
MRARRIGVNIANLLRSLRSVRREARREIVEALEESSWRWSTKK